MCPNANHGWRTWLMSLIDYLGWGNNPLSLSDLWKSGFILEILRSLENPELELKKLSISPSSLRQEISLILVLNLTRICTISFFALAPIIYYTIQEYYGLGFKWLWRQLIGAYFCSRTPACHLYNDLSSNLTQICETKESGFLVLD